MKNLEDIPFEELYFLIVSVKSYDLRELFLKFPRIRHRIPVVLVQNGLGIEDEIKGKNLDIYRFVCHLAVYKEKDYKIWIKQLKKINYLGGKDIERGREISKIFTLADLKTIFKEDIKKYIWEKTILNSLLNPLCAIFQKNMKETLKIKGIDFVLRNILKESLQVARKENIIFNKGFEKEAFKYLKIGGYHIPSMVFDLKKGRTEIDFLNGKISQIGRKHKIFTPLNDFIVSLIKNNV